MADFVKRLEKRAFWGMLGFALALVIIWAVLLRFVPAGWWVTAINIGFFIATAIVVSRASIWFFKPRVRLVVAVIISAAIWVLMVVVIRSAILELLGVI